MTRLASPLRIALCFAFLVAACSEDVLSPSAEEQDEVSATAAEADPAPDTDPNVPKLLTLAEFVGSIDPETGEVHLDLIDVDDWEFEHPSARHQGFVTVPQALWCTQLQDSGGTATLTVQEGTLGMTPAECGLPSTPRFMAWGALCFDVELRSRASTVMVRPMVEITGTDPGFEGYRYTETDGIYGVDPAVLSRGPNPPSDLRGLFGYPSLDIGGRSITRWAFRYPGGTWGTFRGRVVAEVQEICNGIDDDCDGMIDEGAGCFQRGEACNTDWDCATGNCTVAGVCGLSQCEDGIRNGSESDVDCGGMCGKCNDGRACVQGSDCVSGNCRDDRCVPYRHPQRGEIVLTELMPNPGPLEDQDLEWIELRNASLEPLDLDGCRIHASSGTPWVIQNQTMLPFQLFTLVHNKVATGTDHDQRWSDHHDAIPGIKQLYDGFNLNNSGDILTLSCPGPEGGLVTIDRIQYDASMVHRGIAIQVHSDTLTADANDQPAALCDARNIYTGSYRGSPGAANHSCNVPITQCTFIGPANLVAPRGSTVELISRVLSTGFTDRTRGIDRLTPRLYGQLGFGPRGTDPAVNAGWTWFGAAPAEGWIDTAAPNYDEWRARFQVSGTVGNIFDTRARFTGNNGSSWTYCLGSSTLTVGEPSTTPTEGTSVFFSELMANPAGDDATGEWFEITNASINSYNLMGCQLSTSDASHTITTSLPIGPAARLVFANRATSTNGPPTRHYVYSGLELSNDGGSLSLHCPGTSAPVLIDTFTWSAEDARPGISLQLAPQTMSPGGNDNPTHWCPTPPDKTFGTVTQQGTPGAANVGCYSLVSCRVQAPDSLDNRPPGTTHTVTGRFRAARLTDRRPGNTPSDLVRMQFGYGNDLTSPTNHPSWVWANAAYDFSYGLSTPGHEDLFDQFRYDFTLPTEGGPWDAAFRVSVDGGANWTFCDRDRRGTPGGADGSLDGYRPADALQVSLAETWDMDDCRLMPVDVQAAIAGDEVQVRGRIFVEGLTEPEGPNPSPSVLAQAGWGVSGTHPNSWSLDRWYDATPESDCTDCEDWDEYQSSFQAPSATPGDYEIAFRFSTDGGLSWSTCDTEGTGWDSDNAGSLHVCGWQIAYCHVGNSHTNLLGVSGLAGQAHGMVYAPSEGDPDGCNASPLTSRSDRTDPSPDLVAAFGWGEEPDPLNWSDWSEAFPVARHLYHPGHSEYEENVDQYRADFSYPAPGEYYTAYRFSGDGGNTWTLCGPTRVWEGSYPELGTMTVVSAP